MLWILTDLLISFLFSFFAGKLFSLCEHFIASYCERHYSISVVCNICKFISNEKIVITQIYYEERQSCCLKLKTFESLLARSRSNCFKRIM